MALLMINKRKDDWYVKTVDISVKLDLFDYCHSYNVSSTALSWNKLSKEGPSCVLTCTSEEGMTSPPTIYIKVLTLASLSSPYNCA